MLVKNEELVGATLRVTSPGPVLVKNEELVGVAVASDPAPELFPSQVSAGPTPGPETHLPSGLWRFLSLEPPGPLLCRTSLPIPEVSHAPKKMHPSLLFVEGYSLKKEKKRFFFNF